jgi:hypothetical protein
VPATPRRCDPKYCIKDHMSRHAIPINCCRMCGATSYRKVVARDESGAMKSTGLYQCSGCSVVFADPRAWREGEGGGGELEGPSPSAMARRRVQLDVGGSQVGVLTPKGSP